MPRDELIPRLQTVRELLHSMGMEISADVIDEMLSAILVKSGRDRMNSLYSKLGIAIQEFVTSEYRKRCFVYVSKIANDAMRFNSAKVAATLGDPVFTEIQRERTEAFTVLTRISSILEKGASNPYEKILGQSFSYAHLAEGVFKRSVQDCYLVDEIGHNNPVYIAKIRHLDVGQIMEEYKKKQKDLTIFEGWDGVVRNAVSHARMHYDKTRDKMTFVDLTSKRSRNKTYSFNELQESYSKLFDVFSLVLIRNQMWRTSEILHSTEKG